MKYKIQNIEGGGEQLRKVTCTGWPIKFSVFFKNSQSQNWAKLNEINAHMIVVFIGERKRAFWAVTNLTTW